MKEITYYAIFDQSKNEEGIAVTFPDIFGGVTSGKDKEDALKMAKDLLLHMLKNAPSQCEKPLSYEKMRALFPKRHLEAITVTLED